MATKISAGTTTGTALSMSADTTGILQLATGSVPTTAITIDASQNVNFSGTAQRITGDMTNATFANRLAFQTSTTNGQTVVTAIPNGTGTISQFQANSNGADPANASVTGLLSIAGSDARFNSAVTGTGTYLPMTFWTTNTEQMRIATDGTITGTKGNLQLISGTAVASTSGTSIDFTGIPSWAKRVTVMFNENSTNGSSNRLVQIGSGSVTTTGYISSGGYGGGATSSTAGFVVWIDVASYALSGQMVFTLLASNLWVASHVGKVSTGQCAFGGGSVTLGGALDRERITTVNGTDAFDAGSINILYE
jgi:hypothetical protein